MQWWEKAYTCVTPCWVYFLLLYYWMKQNKMPLARLLVGSKQIKNLCSCFMPIHVRLVLMWSSLFIRKVGRSKNVDFRVFLHIFFNLDTVTMISELLRRQFHTICSSCLHYKWKSLLRELLFIVFSKSNIQKNVIAWWY